MDSVSFRYSFCGKSDVCMDGWIMVSLRYRKDGWMDKCKFEIDFLVLQMYGWKDG